MLDICVIQRTLRTATLQNLDMRQYIWYHRITVEIPQFHSYLDILQRSSFVTFEHACCIQTFAKVIRKKYFTSIFNADFISQ